MPDGDSQSPIDKAPLDEPSRQAERAPDNDQLAMPQEDDPAGDGHMGSGKVLIAVDRPQEDEEGGASGHIPIQPTNPIPF